MFIPLIYIYFHKLKGEKRVKRSMHLFLGKQFSESLVNGKSMVIKYDRKNGSLK